MIHEALTRLKEVGFTVLEARLMGLSKKRRRDGEWAEIVLQVLPEEMPSELFVVKLGTRMHLAMVQIGDDEQPQKPKRAFKDLPLSQQAAIRCADLEFQKWCAKQAWENGISRWPKTFERSEAEGLAAEYVRTWCWVDSRAQLDKEDRFGQRWAYLNAQFEADTRMAERRG